MSTLGRAFIAGVMIVAPSIGPVAVAEAQPPIRIGASLSHTGSYAALSQNQVGRGYPLCVKHTNEKGGVLGRKHSARSARRSPGTTSSCICCRSSGRRQNRRGA
jgi:hypothetical protein